MAEHVLKTESLAAGYGKQIVADGLTFRIRRGEILSLIGPNGAGKSTVLKTIAAQLPAISGKIAICGIPTAEISRSQLAQKMSVLLTERLRTERMSCLDVAATGRYPYTGIFGVLSEQDWNTVRHAMQLTGCEQLADADFSQISDGQRQCVMLARAIAQEPEILLLDEPTSFLDISHKMQIMSMIRKLAREQQIGVIVSLHELELAQKYADQVLCIHNGKAERCGPPETIFDGDYIASLYGMQDGCFLPAFGTVEPQANRDAPQVFVIGGGGSGIPVYRRLQRADIPFAAGILHENDVEYPIAKALASVVIAARAFEPIAQDTLSDAITIMQACRDVLCLPESFGTMNQANAELRKLAESSGKLRTIEQILPPDPFS